MRPETLSKLHDFFQPSPPSWTPQTAGWYILFALITLLLAWVLWRVWTRWRRNRYRREALRELDHVDPSTIPVLLKRTALAAWPRESVASLSGEPWLNFLEVNGGNGSFSKESRHVLLDLEYRNANLTAEDERALRRFAGDWIRRHHVRA